MIEVAAATAAAGAGRELTETLARLPSIGLGDVLALADLQVRQDRKYLVPTATVNLMLADLGASLAALEIAGRREFGYESVYFDSPDLLTYRMHARGRPRRFKVRTRTYVDSGQCMVEVKSEGLRGQTVKARLAHPYVQRHVLTASAREFVRTHVPTVDPDTLAESMLTAYSRRTLVDVAGAHRLTLDTDLAFVAGDRRVVGPEELVLVEIKSAGPPTPADRWLWWHRLRPVSVSKYCLGAALVDPTLPASRWSRVLRTHFDWEPTRQALGLAG